LRRLDAVKPAAALALRDGSDSVVTYDERLAAAARAKGSVPPLPPESEETTSNRQIRRQLLNDSG